MYMILTEKFQKTTCMQPPAGGWMTGRTGMKLKSRSAAERWMMLFAPLQEHDTD